MATNSKPKQTDRVFDYMKRFGSISTWDAFKDLGVSRLSARIYELKSQGINIKKDTFKSVNRFGDPITTYRYILEQTNE